MKRFSGKIGFADGTTETRPGVWEDTMIERSYYGDVIRDAPRFQEGDKINLDLSVKNAIRIVADAYASEHIFAMRYIEWQGALWIISDVEVQRPRLLLRLGGVYNGIKA